MGVLLATLILAAGVQTMPVPRTPESSTIMLQIAIPQNGEVVAAPVSIQFRIDGYALGAPSQFERASEIVQTDMGQTVHIIIDDRPYFPVNEPAIDPFNEDGNYYDTSYRVTVPFRLKEGSHTIRMFPARSFGESLKGEGTFAAVNFYVGSDTGSPVNLTRPYLTYNEPSDQMFLVEDKPILLDFYVSNAELSSDGYKVRLTVDGKFDRNLTAWQPFYIYGLKKGRHTIQLELLNSENKLVPGPFNHVKRTITVH